MDTKITLAQSLVEQKPTRMGGMAVRTNLRAGLAWDDLDDQAKALFDKLKSSVSTAVTNLTNDSQ